MSVETVEQPVAVVPEPVTVEPATPSVDEQLPVRAHAAKFSEAGRQKEAEALANETPEQKTARQAKSDQQERDRKNGQFKPGLRHKAESQKATPDDVPRINQLTARAKTAEERVVALEQEVARLKATGAPVAQVAKAEAKVEAAVEKASGFAEPEPTEDDPKFAGDYGKYLRAVSSWEGRKAYHDERASERQREADEKSKQTEREALKSFGDRMEAAKEKYPDFDAVTDRPTPWLNAKGKPLPHAIALDSWVMEHKSGPDVLYYFQLDKNRQELDSLLAKPVIEQVDHLALLSQRLLPTSSSQAGVTGSVAGRTSSYVPPPKPPNPVRTEAQRTSGGPPPTDGSLGVLSHAKQWRKTP